MKSKEKTEYLNDYRKSLVMFLNDEFIDITDEEREAIIGEVWNVMNEVEKLNNKLKAIENYKLKKIA